MKYCIKCGRENKDDAKFCMGCGERFASETVESEEQNPNNYNYFTDTYAPTGNKKRGSVGKVSMILGIIAACFGVLCCCFPLGLPLGIVSVVLGIISLKKNPNHQKGMAIAGIILGAIAALVGIYLLVFLPDIMETTMKELEYIVMETCKQDPYSDECQAYKEAFPQFFQ